SFYFLKAFAQFSTTIGFGGVAGCSSWRIRNDPSGKMSYAGSPGPPVGNPLMPVGRGGPGAGPFFDIRTPTISLFARKTHSSLDFAHTGSDPPPDESFVSGPGAGSVATYTSNTPVSSDTIASHRPSGEGRPYCVRSRTIKGRVDSGRPGVMV